MKLPIKKLRENATLPRRATPESAGLDLCACIDAPIELAPDSTHSVPTGIALEIPKGFVGLVFARSGLAVRHGIAPVNAVGVIDSDYRGELLVALRNCYAQKYVINPNERIAQLVIMPIELCEATEVCELDETLRGGGGFGSTGKE